MRLPGQVQMPVTHTSLQQPTDHQLGVISVALNQRCRISFINGMGFFLTAEKPFQESVSFLIWGSHEAGKQEQRCR